MDFDDDNIDDLYEYSETGSRCDCGDPLITEEEVERGLCEDCLLHSSERGDYPKELDFD